MKIEITEAVNGWVVTINKGKTKGQITHICVNTAEVLHRVRQAVEGR